MCSNVFYLYQRKEGGQERANTLEEIILFSFTEIVNRKNPIR